MPSGRELISKISADPKLLNDLKARDDAGKYDLLVSRGLLKAGDVMPSRTSLKLELARPAGSPTIDRLRPIDVAKFDFGNIDVSKIDLNRVLGQTVDLGGGRPTRPIDPAGRVVEWVGAVAGAVAGAASAACTAD
jgi:hypothetical protein